MLIMLNPGRANAHEPGLAMGARIGRGHGKEHSPQPQGLTKAAIALRDIISRRAAEPPSRRAAEPPSRRAAEPPSRRAAGHECALAALSRPPSLPA